MIIICLLLAGLAEGAGISSALPVIGLAAARADAGTAGPAGTAFEAYVSSAVHTVGLEPTAGVLLTLLTIGMVLRAGLVVLANKHVGYAVAHMATDLRLALIRALLRSRWEYYVHQPIGIFANAVASEARRASQAYFRATSIGTFLIQAGVYVGLGLLVSWRATLVALLVTAAVLSALGRLVRAARRAGVRQTKVARSLIKQLTDALQSAKPLKAMGREGLIGPLLEGDTQQLNRALEREVLSNEGLQALQDPLLITFLAVGLYAAQTHLAVPLATVILLTVLCTRIAAGLGKAQKEYQHMVASESAFWSLRSMIEQAEGAREQPAGNGIPSLRHAITLRDVRFAYDGRPILSDASLVVPARQLTVITGPSGAGKTTVADLIIGLIRPQTGTVLIDDVRLDTLDARRWRALIGYVPQETFLLHDSVALNVTLGDPDLPPAAVETALRAAGAWDFVAALPQGMDTVVGERGLRLSGGQRQRIALARALIRTPQLLILDEATAALDPPTEAAVCSTLQSLAGPVTILAICHQGPLIALAAQVYRVQDGTIMPAGASG